MKKNLQGIMYSKRFEKNDITTDNKILTEAVYSDKKARGLSLSTLDFTFHFLKTN